MINTILPVHRRTYKSDPNPGLGQKLMDLGAVPSQDHILTLGKLTQKSRHKVRQKILPGNGRGTHTELPVACLRSGALQAPAAVQNLLRLLINLPPPLRQHHRLPCAPLNQPGSQNLFQTVDVRADRRLGQIQSARRLGEAAILRRGDKGLQLLQIDFQHNFSAFLFP